MKLTCNILFYIFWLFVPPFCLASLEELQVLYDRKVDFIIQDYNKNFNQIPTWMHTFNTVNGTWSDVDYTSGCSARRANWPAQQHFVRILTMASQLCSNIESTSDNSLLPQISKAMDYWFDNNYEPDTCLDEGGLSNSTCQCGTPGFWNTNWFGQMILMPKLISNACLLLKTHLTTTQLGNCTHVIQRVYNRIDTFVLGIGPMTGANMLDSASSVLNLGLLTNNETIVRDALEHFYNQTIITKEVGVDGVKVDGSYLQHGSQLYTGNYGKDFINSVVVAYIQTSNTSFAPPLDSQRSFLTLINGTEWMVITNNYRSTRYNATISDLFWQYSVIGRMVSFPVSDKQASGGVALNLTRIEQATASWSNATIIHDITQRLSDAMNQSFGQGNLTGTRSFFTSDYLVHRSAKYVTTLKSFSQRTSNSECNNDQNPFGFHLSDGSLFTYIDGDEYQDVFAAWDWNLVPGTTVDYGATPLGCNITQYFGNTTFVGSVTPHHELHRAQNGGGMAVMDYIHPMTGHLKWQKTFYFFPGFYAVQIDPVYTVQNTTSHIITTLDQSNLKGDVYMNGRLLTKEETQAHYPFEMVLSSSKEDKCTGNDAHIWHNRVLYTIVAPQKEDGTMTLKVSTASHDNNSWSSIGISNGSATQPIFTATIEHSQLAMDTNHYTGLSYIAQLNTESKVEENTKSLIQFIRQDDDIKGKVRGAYHTRDKSLALAFWTAGVFISPWGLTVKTDKPILSFFTVKGKEKKCCKSYILTASDPTQSLTNVTITVAKQRGFDNNNSIKRHSSSRRLVIQLPQGENAGSSVSVTVVFFN
ncbi:MAG: chondroitin AC/alginate lyase [Benjaminiella poitrasii]|nr:MAG: chondroitin AC/alginate lyase [Benjaminiella poitrasii]